MKEPAEIDRKAFWVTTGELLRRARLVRGWTVARVAKKTSYSKSMISQVENGKLRMPAERLFHLARLLSIDLINVSLFKLPSVCPQCRGEGVVNGKY